MALQAMRWDTFADPLSQEEKEVLATVPCTTNTAAGALKASLKTSIMTSCSRVDIDFPPGIRLGLALGVVDSLSVPSGPLTNERVAVADQELAQYVAILLQNVEKLRFAFRTGSLAKSAKQAWSKDALQGSIMAITRSKKQGGSFSEVDEHIAFRKAILGSPEGFLVVVAPRAKQLRVIDQISKEVGPNKCVIILLNARLRGLQEENNLRERLGLEYLPAFNLRLVGQHGQEGIVYRHMREGGDLSPWMLAQRQLEPSPDGKSEDLVGKVVYSSELEPSPSEIAATFGLET